MLNLFAAALAEEASPVQDVVDQVGGIIETAGDKAGSFLKGLPLLTTRLLMAGLAIFVGVIVLRIGRRMISSIVKKRGQKDKKTAVIADYAAKNSIVHQLIDLALLQNGMLKGEALDRFLKRSVDLIK